MQADDSLPASYSGVVDLTAHHPNHILGSHLAQQVISFGTCFG